MRAILSIGGSLLIVDQAVAVAFIQALNTPTFERYDTVYRNGEFVPVVRPWGSGTVSIQLLTDEQYALGKLQYAAEEKTKQGESK